MALLKDLIPLIASLSQCTLPKIKRIGTSTYHLFYLPEYTAFSAAFSVSQQKIKDYYDHKSKTPNFQIGQSVWVYTPKTKKGLSRKLLQNWFGPYRIVEQSSPVHFRLRTENNKKVTFAVHANRMKHFFDPTLRPIDPPLFDDATEPYLDEADSERLF